MSDSCEHNTTVISMQLSNFLWYIFYNNKQLAGPSCLHPYLSCQAIHMEADPSVHSHLAFGSVNSD